MVFPVTIRHVVVLSALATLPTAGCGAPRRPALRRAAVSGTVTLDGRPLAEGEVMFFALGGEAVDALPVRDGAFAGSVTVGPQRVEFAAFTTVQRSIFPGKPSESVRDNALPPKYHAESTVTADIRPDGNAPLAFDLHVGPGKATRPGN